MGLDYRITVYNPAFTAILNNDCSGDVVGITYEDTPSGCGAATLELGLYREDVIQRGVYQQREIFEISTGDMTLQQPIAAGATKAYIDTTWPLDSAQGEDAQQLYFWAPTYGATMRLAVTGIGSDAGGAYVTFGAPDGKNGNPSTMPAYPAGAIVGRRRYTGSLIRRTLPAARKPGGTLSLIGLGSFWGNANGTVTITTAANVDIATALYDILSQFSTSHFPFLYFLASNFATTGTKYVGTLTLVGMDRFISDALGAFPNDDQWVVRVGHDRTPRLVRLFNSTSDTYTYTVTLAQGVSQYEALAFEGDDEDCSALYNQIQVSGNSSSSTGQNVVAQVNDPASISFFGFQIDGSTSSNSALTTIPAAASYAAGLLKQNSIARAKNKLLVYTGNDAASGAGPGGISRGDAVRGTACVRVTNFDDGGVSLNLIPDSQVTYWSGVDALWSGVTASQLATYAPDGANAIAISVANGGYANSPTFPVAAGRVYRMSGTIDASQSPNFDAISQWVVIGYPGETVLATARATKGAAAQAYTSAPFTVPAGITSAIVQFTNSANQTGAIGSTIGYWPILYAGSVIKPYVPNNASPTIYGLVSSVVTHVDTKKLDAWQEAQFNLIEPDWSSAIDEKTNAAVTSILQNRATLSQTDRYSVSPEARDYAYGPSALTVSIPAFDAVFAAGSGVVVFAEQTVTLAASTTNFVWLELPSAIVVNQSPASIDGAILLAYFTTSAAGVIGDFFKASISNDFRTGVANADPSTTLIAPAFGAVTIANGASVNGIASDIDVSLPLTNVPGDGSALQLELYYRITAASGAGVNAWIAVDAVNLAYSTTTKLPTSPSQTVGFSYGTLVNGAAYDFAAAYSGKTGYGPLSIFQNGWVARLIAIGAAYQFGGAVITPGVTAANAVNSVSANNITASVLITCSVNNQPTDTSLSKVNFWRRLSSQNNDGQSGANMPGAPGFHWAPIGGVPADGVGLPSASLSASASYAITDSDAAGNQHFDFGITYESTSGGESLLQPMIENFETTVIQILPGQIVGADAPNLVKDSNVDYLVGGNPTYFSCLIFDNNSFGVGTGGVKDAGGIENYFYFRPAYGAKLGHADTVSPINVVPGSAYVVSCYIDATTVSAGGAPQIQVISADKTAVYGAAAQTPGVNGRVSTVVTIQPGVTQIYVRMTNNSCVVKSSILVFGVPMFQAGSVMGGYKPGSIVDQGTIAHEAQSAQTQATILLSPGPEGSYLGQNTVARRQIIEGGKNQVFNPTAAEGTAGWTTYTMAGLAAAAFGFDAFMGGRFVISTTGVTNALYEQQLPLTANSKYALSGLIETNGFSTSANYAFIDIVDTSGTSIINSASVTGAASGRVPVSSVTFATPSNGIVVVRLRVFTNTAPSSTIYAYFYDIQVEGGSVSTSFADDTSGALVTKTHNPSGYVYAGSTQYTGGTTVDSLKPAQAGADVTGSNTSANTALVTGATYTGGGNVDAYRPAEPGANVTGNHVARDVVTVNGQTAASFTSAVATGGNLIGIGSTAFTTGSFGASGNTSGTSTLSGSGYLSVPSVSGALWYVEAVFNAPGSNLALTVSASAGISGITQVSGFSGGTYLATNQTTAVSTLVGVTSGGVVSVALRASNEATDGNNANGFSYFQGTYSIKATRYA